MFCLRVRIQFRNICVVEHHGKVQVLIELFKLAHGSMLQVEADKYGDAVLAQVGEEGQQPIAAPATPEQLRGTTLILKSPFELSRSASIFSFPPSTPVRLSSALLIIRTRPPTDQAANA